MKTEKEQDIRLNKLCFDYQEREKRIAELDMKRKAERKIFQGIVEKKNDQLTNERRKNRKLKKENADLKGLLSLVYKDLISYKTNPNNLAVEGTFEMEKSVFMDWLHRVKPFVTEGEVKKMTKEEQLKEEAENKLDEWSDPDMGCEEGYCYSEVADFMFRFAEPREKQIADLKERNEAQGETIAFYLIDHEEKAKRIADLEKENAELKNDNKVMTDNYSKMEQKFYNNLSKAKELLNEFMRISKASDEDFEHDYSELIGEAERFINSEVEK